MKDVRKLLADGKVTMPAEWRRKNGLVEGDSVIVQTVIVKQNEFGAILVTPANVSPKVLGE